MSNASDTEAATSSDPTEAAMRDVLAAIEATAPTATAHRPGEPVGHGTIRLRQPASPAEAAPAEAAPAEAAPAEPPASPGHGPIRLREPRPSELGALSQAATAAALADVADALDAAD